MELIQKKIIAYAIIYSFFICKREIDLNHSLYSRFIESLRLKTIVGKAYI